MRPLKKFDQGGVPQGDPVGDVVKKYATKEELARMKYLNMLIDTNPYDYYEVMDTAVGRRRSKSDMYGELDNIISGIQARKEEEERQERLSKGNPKPGPYEFAAGGRTPMSFMNKKFR